MKAAIGSRHGIGACVEVFLNLYCLDKVCNTCHAERL